MKYATKFMVVPYVPRLENSDEKFLTNLDSEMSRILTNQKMSTDEKVKMYNQALQRFIINNPQKRSVIISDKSTPSVKVEPKMEPLTVEQMDTIPANNTIINEPATTAPNFLIRNEQPPIIQPEPVFNLPSSLFAPISAERMAAFDTSAAVNNQKNRKRNFIKRLVNNTSRLNRTIKKNTKRRLDESKRQPSNAAERSIQQMELNPNDEITDFDYDTPNLDVSNIAREPLSKKKSVEAQNRVNTRSQNRSVISGLSNNYRTDNKATVPIPDINNQRINGQTGLGLQWKTKKFFK